MKVKQGSGNCGFRPSSAAPCSAKQRFAAQDEGELRRSRLALWITALVLLPATCPRMSIAQREKEIANFFTAEHAKSAETELLRLYLASADSALSAVKSYALVWDTQSPFVDTVDIRDRTNWRPVPTDLLTLEANPPVASSDPGYYGREYSFKGDAVVENERLTAVFWSGKGRVVIYSKVYAGQKRIEFVPLQLKRGPVSITCCKILQNTGDEAALEVFFSGEAAGENVSAIFSFSKMEIVEIKPAENTKGISLFSPIEYGIVPSFIGDDLIFDPRAYPSTDTLCIPSENVFLGLLKGENSMLVVTWPKAKQQMRLALESERPASQLIQSVDFDNDGQSIYLAILEAPGIWHKEQLQPSYLEKDIAINWKRPFPAKWVTQLNEAEVKTTFTFRESKGNIWRGVTGSYVYPVWFSGDSAFYHLSKKIPPKGESLIYFLERKNTPLSVSAPVDIAKATLGRQMCDTILDLPGRVLRTHHRRGDAGIRRACTCGCTEAMQAVFEAGEEVQRKEYVEGAVDDMVYFVTRHVERINEYQDFARDMMEFLSLAEKSHADLKPFLDSIESIAQEILQEYSRQRDNIKSLEYADQLAQKTKALTAKKDPGNPSTPFRAGLSTYSGLSEKWRAMGGAQDDLVAQSHRITRKLSQQAGYGCVNDPKAVQIAEEVRSRCRKCLRNPDGYEIWPDY